MTGVVKVEQECVFFPALDRYEGASVPIGKWLACVSASPKEYAYALDDFAIACLTLGKFTNSGEDFRGLWGEPHVAYNPITDRHFYIFKFAKKGSTYLVGKGVSLFGGHS